MKHLGFVGKSTEYLGYTHVEIINSSLRLSFNIPSKNDLKAILHSKRANLYYLEHTRVMQEDGRVLYLTEAKKS